MRIPDKTQLLKMARHVFRRSSGVPDKRLLHPRREWAIALICFGLILIIGSIVSAQSFTRFRSLDTSGGMANVTVPRYNETQVTEVIETYRAKEAAYNELVGEVPFIPTPIGTSSTSTARTNSAGQTDIPIADRFPEKLVYASAAGLDEDAYIAHCDAEGGTFNTCGSVCPATAEVCTRQCAFTCEFTDGTESEGE